MTITMREIIAEHDAKKLEESRTNAPGFMIESADKAIQQAEALANDERYSHAHKADQIAVLMETTTSAIEAHAALLLEKIEAEIVTRRSAAVIGIIPAGIDPTALLYAQNVLTMQWASMDYMEIIGGWTAALHVQDKISATVYLHQAIAFMRRRSEQDEDLRGNLPIPVRDELDALTKRTLELLRSPEQALAAIEVERLELHKQAITQGQISAANKVRYLAYDSRSGKLTTDTSKVLGRTRSY